MTKNQSSEISQLHRLQGQLQAVERMIVANKKPSEIIQQIEAVCGSLKALEKKLLKENLKSIKDAELKKSIDAVLKT